MAGTQMCRGSTPIRVFFAFVASLAGLACVADPMSGMRFACDPASADTCAAGWACVRVGGGLSYQGVCQPAGEAADPGTLDPGGADDPGPDLPPVPDVPAEGVPDGCVPNCGPRECGDDGCGGICGTCAEGRACVQGTCRAPLCDAEAGCLVPEGDFDMGCQVGDPPKCDTEEQPIHLVHVPAFRIGWTEVSVADYRACHAAKPQECTAPGASHADCNWPKELTQHDRDLHPVNCVSKAQASAFCKWKGWGLCTEAQWEYAARGADRRVYPWGGVSPGAGCDRAVDADCASCSGRTCEVGTTVRSGGGSPFGVLDLAGNVWEIVQDEYHMGYGGAPLDGSAWGDAAAAAWVVRGGGYSSGPGDVRTTSRLKTDATFPNTSVGFRCCRGAL